MNKSQTEAVKSAIVYLNSVGSLLTGECGELGEPNINEIALLGMLNCDILVDAFPQIAKQVLATEPVDDGSQMEFNFVP